MGGEWLHGAGNHADDRLGAPLFRDRARARTKPTPVETLALKQLLHLKMPYQALPNAALDYQPLKGS